jgi:hypothetical protein
MGVLETTARRLVDAVPQLGAVFDRNLTEAGQLEVWNFMDEVSHFACERMREAGAEDAQLQALLASMESILSTGEPHAGVKSAQNLVPVTILEGILNNTEHRSQFLAILATRLKAEAEIIKHTEDALWGLTEAVPELRPLLEEHAAYYHEILPHVFMEDEVVRFLLERLAQYGPEDKTLKAVLNYLNRAFEAVKDGPDKGLSNVIAVSFIEHLHYRGEFGPKLAAILPPSLAAELARQEAWARAHAAEMNRFKQRPDAE